VGIGATSLSNKLEVNGNINIPTFGFFRYNGDTGLIGSATSIAGGDEASLGIRSANNILFATNGSTERMRINASGNVGIGAASYTPKLAVSKLGATALAGYENPSGYNGRFEPSAIYGVARLGGGDLASNKDYAGVLGVGRVDAGGTPGAGHRIFGVLATESNGLGFDAKTFAFGAIGPSIFDGTVGVGVTPTSRNNTTLQIKDGIGFPATQVASSDANTLDDYEEGTFTPTASSGITINTINNATYTKIGNTVTFQIWIKVDIGSADFVIAGLPFTGSGRTAGSMSNTSEKETIANLIINNEIYGFAATTVLDDDLLIGGVYRVA
jgi:hypothetical protein